MLSGSSQLPTAAMSWALLPVLWLMVQTQAMAMKQTPELKLRGIVYPKQLPIAYEEGMENNQSETRGKEERYAPEVQYQIVLNGEEIILQLHKTKHLLGPDYAETYYSPEGEEVTRNSQSLKHCYYEGHILNEKDSVARISTCDGLRGYFTHHDQRYLIKPLESTDQRKHEILTCDQKEPDAASHMCGVRRVGRKRGHRRTSRSLKSPEQEDFLRVQKYIDLYLVLDNAFYKAYKGNVTLIRSFLFDVLTLLNVIYNTIDTHVSLVGMEIWSDADKIKVEPNIGTTFNNFLRWHWSNQVKKVTHDHAQLLSGVDFGNGRAGMAASNSLCSPSSISVIAANKKNNVALVGLISHELGHALGMPDVPYTTKCPSGSCVMNQYLSSKFPKDFSTSCLSNFQKYFLSRSPKCLLQAPLPKNIITNPVCGNQILEVGEDCDCGSPTACADLCCEAATCKLKAGADCGEDVSAAPQNESKTPLH